MATVIWFTGLSGSGKTTLALELKKKLEELDKSVNIIDGDAIRNTIHNHLGFSREDINTNNLLIANLCNKNSDKFDFILVPVISPYKEDRELARKIIGGNFIELYLNAPLQECIKRDVKGLYKKALAGEIKNFIGVHNTNPYETPENPDIVVDTANKTVTTSVAEVLEFLFNKQLITNKQKHKTPSK